MAQTNEKRVENIKKDKIDFENSEKNFNSASVQ